MPHSAGAPGVKHARWCQAGLASWCEVEGSRIGTPVAQCGQLKRLGAREPRNQGGAARKPAYPPRELRESTWKISCSLRVVKGYKGIQYDEGSAPSSVSCRLSLVLAALTALQRDRAGAGRVGLGPGVVRWSESPKNKNRE